MARYTSLVSASAVAVRGVSKRFTLYHQGGSGLKERLVGLVGGRRESRETFWALRDVSVDVATGAVTVTSAAALDDDSVAAAVAAAGYQLVR